jgi:hypothetical protein
LPSVTKATEPALLAGSAGPASARQKTRSAALRAGDFMRFFMLVSKIEPQIDEQINLNFYTFSRPSTCDLSTRPIK